MLLQIGLNVEGIDLSTENMGASPSGQESTNESASVVIIGMRGSGKSFIGKLASVALSWSFLDADTYFEEKHQVGVREFVHQNGWPAFREAEMEVLKKLLTTYSTRHVISLGGGIVETPSARDVLKSYAKKGPIIHIVRELHEIIKYLGEETARPAYGEPVADVFRRREPWFAECSNYDFLNYTGIYGGGGDATGSKLTNSIRSDVTRFFGHITGQHPNLVSLSEGRRSYVLTLPYPDITLSFSDFEELTAGVDAIELRVDLLRSPEDGHKFGHYIPPIPYVSKQIHALRQHTTLPIVFALRTISQGGRFPDHSEKEALELFRSAIRFGVEYLEVEITWSAKLTDDLVSKKGPSRIIASWHDSTGKFKWGSQSVEEKYREAEAFGDLVKIVLKPNGLGDNFALHHFVEQKRLAGAKPLIAVNTGIDGQMSHILNATLSPVTHPLLINKSTIGQLSFAQIQTALHLIGQQPPLRFFLFGKPISQSMSPTLHNTGFGILGLPHKYELLETDEVGEEIKATIASPDFGGASVTIPYKLDIIPLLDSLSPEAEVIGAVNTVIPRRTTNDSLILYGDNTDWLGIRACIISRLPPALQSPETALVIGAGGTSRAAIYALHRLGIQKIYLYNRTRSSAQVLVDTFTDVKIQVLEALGSWPEDGVPPSVIVSTVPASATTFDPNATESLYLPSEIFASPYGVVVDMAYRPSETPLLKLAAKVAKNWEVVRGLDVLLEQGFAQFSAWTGRQCPRRAVSEVVWKAYMT